MTELERQLTRALRELSAQYEREQQRPAAQAEGLQAQVQRLDGQVQRLAEDYNQLASDYSGLASDYKALVRLCGISGVPRRR